MEHHTITIASDLGAPTGNNSLVKMLSNNSFIEEHGGKDGFAVLLVPASPIAGGTNIVHSIYHGNCNIGHTGSARYGFSYISTSTSAVGMVAMTVKVNGTSYNVSFRAASNGDLHIYIANNRTLKAGTYKLVLMCMEV